MFTAFITGCTGHIGSNLARYLLERDYKVIGLKRRTSLICTDRIDDIYNDSNFKLEYFDLTDNNSIWSLLLKYKPHFFFNMAAQSHVKVSFELTESTVDMTALGVIRILDAIKAVSPHTRFFQSSSSEMFGNSPPPQSELTPFDPQSPYAAAKVFGFHIVKNYRNSYGLYLTNGIMFNTEGETRGETFVTRKITLGIANIDANKQECIYLGNLDAKRDWQHVDDTVDGIYKIVHHKKPDDFVIGTGETHSIREFVEEAFDCAGYYKKHCHWEGKDLDEKYICTIGKSSILVRVDPKYFRPSEVNVLQADNRKAIEKLNWKSAISFKELVKRMVNHDLRTIKR